MTSFPVQVNADLLYRAPDGLEAFVVFDAHGRAHFGTAVGVEPARSVGFSVEALGELVQIMQRRAQHADI